MADSKPKPKRTAKAYKMPEKFLKGEKLKDKATKIEWIIQDSIGVGGFGEIYAAAKATEPKQVRYAIKIEPHENGPLFCERSVYINIGREKDLEEYRSARKLRYLGIPTFHGFGSHSYKNKDYRFIVIDKLGKDVWSLYKANNGMPYDTAIKIGIQILHVLEYMHGKGYVHCDVKGANLLLGELKGTENQVYVVDFGLACKYTTKDIPNPKKAHNGTIEYTSRDAHRGVMTRRGDVEILSYNLLHWASGRLPWDKESNLVSVQNLKEKHMAALDKLLKDCYKTETPHVAVKDFLHSVSRLNPLDEPDYDHLRLILTKELKKLKSDVNKLVFVVKKTPVKRPAATSARKGTPARKKTHVSETESDEEDKSESEEEVPKSRRRIARKVIADDKVAVKSPLVDRTTKTNVKRSWRDCPTIVNGGGGR